MRHYDVGVHISRTGGGSAQVCASVGHSCLIADCIEMCKVSTTLPELHSSGTGDCKRLSFYYAMSYRPMTNFPLGDQETYDSPLTVTIKNALVISCPK